MTEERIELNGGQIVMNPLTLTAGHINSLYIEHGDRLSTGQVTADELILMLRNLPDDGRFYIAKVSGKKMGCTCAKGRSFAYVLFNAAPITHATAATTTRYQVAVPNRGQGVLNDWLANEIVEYAHKQVVIL